MGTRDPRAGLAVATLPGTVMTHDFDAIGNADVHDCHGGPRAFTVAIAGRLDDAGALARRLRLVPPNTSPFDLLALAVARWAEDAPSHLHGAFAFVVHDVRRGIVYAARDAGGTVPLYVDRSYGDADLRFSTDRRSLLDARTASSSLDLASVATALHTGRANDYRHPTRTFVRDLERVPAGHTLVAERGHVRLHRWWRPEELEEDDATSMDEVAERLLATFQTVVADAIPSQRSVVGAHVTGGLDSSAVTAVARSVCASRQQRLVPWTWSPDVSLVPDAEDPKGYDERYVVRAVCDHVGVQPSYLRIDADDVVHHATLDVARVPVVTLMGEVAARKIFVPQGIDTILSGWGGDEGLTFNGRGQLAEYLQRGKPIEALVEARRAARRNDKAWHRPVVAKLVRPFGTAVAETLRSRRAVAVDPTRLPHSLTPSFREALADQSLLQGAEGAEVPGVRRMLGRLHALGHLGGRVESWFAFGRDVGVRYQFPMLDRRVLEAAWQIPFHMFLRDGEGRAIGRRTFAPLLPPDVIANRVKREPAFRAERNRVASHAIERKRSLLAGRRGHPLVDVDRLLGPTHEGDGLSGPTWLAWIDPNVRF